VNIYFPNGISEDNKKLEEMKAYIASFSGETLPETIDGQPFKVELYVDMLKTYPVRLYLHTCLVSVPGKTICSALYDYLPSPPLLVMVLKVSS